MRRRPRNQAGGGEIGVSPFQPRVRLPTQPIYGFEFGLEYLNFFNSTVWPFSLDTPVVAAALNHEEYRFRIVLDHPGIYARFRNSNKTSTLEALKAEHASSRP